MISDLRNVIWKKADSPTCTVCGDRVPKFEWMGHDMKCEYCFKLGDQCPNIMGALSLEESTEMRNNRRAMIESRLNLRASELSTLRINTYSGIDRDTKKFKSGIAAEVNLTVSLIDSTSFYTNEKIKARKILEAQEKQERAEKRAKEMREKRETAARIEKERLDANRKKERENYEKLLKINEIKNCRYGVCANLKIHHDALADDPERLTSDFLIGIICGEEGQRKYRAKKEREKVV
jgi:hypothetical protein